ncbi:DUF3331 domain-containing protein [Paraburkholderia sp. DHOC27]|uniref:DUF3331 domain-containing protein n=1 Tax=Paraburkholderia sp. DHOC27 TaxID=2303330 RepID=UPI0015F32255|nr:DUF3331 domain-containing protein [Paraburkholderia sp. DHOC27]
MNQLDMHSRWQQIVGYLSQDRACVAEAYADASRKGRRRAALSWRDGARVRLVDRLSEHAVSISWGHACSGYDGSQTWRKAIAKKKGVCAMTGERIARGDTIYKLSGSMRGTRRSAEVLSARYVDTVLVEAAGETG